MVTTDVALKASFDPFVIASLPLQNLITTVGAFTAVSGNVITPLNASYAAFAKGNIPGAVAALDGLAANEIGAISNLIGLPAQLIAQDLAAIGFVQNLAAASKSADSKSIAAAADPVTGLLGLASLPLQDLITTIGAFTAVSGGFITPVNAAYAAFAKGDIPGAFAALDGVFQNEVSAFTSLLSLPATLVENNLAYINSIFGLAQASALKTTPLALETADLSAAADPVTGLLTVASLPLQNTITAIGAVTAVTGGFVNPVNAAYAAFAKGDIPGAFAALNGFAANEAAAIGNLLGLPAKIIAQDIATITGAFGGTSMLQAKAEATTFSAAVESGTDEAGAHEEAAPDDNGTATHDDKSKAGQADGQQGAADANDSNGSDKQDPAGDKDQGAGQNGADGQNGAAGSGVGQDGAGKDGSAGQNDDGHSGSADANDQGAGKNDKSGAEESKSGADSTKSGGEKTAGHKHAKHRARTSG